MTARLDPPAHFDDERRAIWAETVTRLTSSGRVFRADPEILGTYVEAVRSHRQASRLLAQTNVMITRDGNAMENPALAIQRKSAEAMARASRALGLDRLPGLPEEPSPAQDRSSPGHANLMATQTPRGKPRSGKGRYIRATDSRKRDFRAAELRGQGFSLQRIADELGFASKGHAHNAVMRAYAEIPSPGAEHGRQLDLERIDRLVEKAWEIMLKDHLTVSQGRIVGKLIGWQRDDNGEILYNGDGKPVGLYEDILDDGPALAAIREIRALLERRAKIMGYEAPAKSRIEVITADMIESQITELESQLARNDPANTGPA